MRTFYFSSILLFNFIFHAGQSILFLPPANYKLSGYQIIEQAFLPPQGFDRINVPENSFAAYLRTLPIVKDSINVLDFQNRIRVKSSDSTLAGVVPVDISGKRLWQCMDIIIRLHVDYLMQAEDPNIIYPLPDGTMLSLKDWQRGIRPVFHGLKFEKILKARADSSANNFERYLNTIFEYSGTQTFWHFYKDIALADISPGDFIVKKGKKSHAVLIVDMAENNLHEKIVLIGQGDTPACQFYLLKQKNGNPWFKINSDSSFPELPIKKRMNWVGLRRFSGR